MTEESRWGGIRGSRPMDADIALSEPLVVRISINQMVWVRQYAHAQNKSFAAVVRQAVKEFREREDQQRQ